MSAAAISIGGSEVKYVSFSVSLSVDATNGSAQCVLHPGEDTGSAGDTFVIQVDGGNIFNGRVYDTGLNEQGAPAVVAIDALAALRHPYQGEDRVYSSSATPGPSDDTDGEIVQNLLEAAGVPVDLTSIEDSYTPIGILRELRIVSGEDLMRYIRLLDQSVVPNFQTFGGADGAVQRRQRTIGTPLITLTATDILSVTMDAGEGIDSIRNGAVVRGYPSGVLIPVGEYTASNALVGDTPQVETLDTFFVETQAAADDLAEWIVGQKNGILRRMTVRALITSTQCLGGTARVSSAFYGLSNHDFYVTDVTHSGDSSGQTTSLLGEWRE